MSHRFLLAFAAVVSISVSVFADALLVKGVVSDSDGKAVNGASVVVSINFLDVLDSVKTNSSGQYSLSTEIESEGSRGVMVIITASADGYGEGFATARVQTPGDGKADTVEQDIELGDFSGWDPGDTTGGNEDGDSLYVSGKVTDENGDPVEGALVTVQAGKSGMGSGTGGTIVSTDASGLYSAAIVNSRASETVTVSVLTMGYEVVREQADIAEPSDGKADVVELDVQMLPEGSEVIFKSVSNVSAGSVRTASVFSMNGRMLGSIKGTEVSIRNALRLSGDASQPAILIWKDTGDRKVIMSKW
jgi:hypothetical protein